VGAAKAEPARAETARTTELKATIFKSRWCFLGVGGEKKRQTLSVQRRKVVRKISW